MFEVIKTNNVMKNENGDLPATTAIVSNNQIGKYISSNNATILKNVFSATANGFGKVFYQPYNFTVLQDSYAFKFKDENVDIKKLHSFVIGCLNKIYSKYDWANKSGWTKIKEEFIQLPILKDGNIDFNFMESFIAELEAERLAELEAYLKATGLKDYELTPNEKQALSDFDNLNWGSFRIGDLFNIHKTFSFNTDKLVEGCEFDYITRTSINQGISQNTGFVNKQNINFANSWSLGLLQMDFFYRKRPWYAGQFVRKVTSKIDLPENAVLFFSTIFNQQKKNLLSVLVRDVDMVFMNTKIKLPIKKDNIDFEFMENFIKAIQKQFIKDVVLYVEKKYKRTKL